MTQAKAGDTVRVHYTGTLADGSEFDTSKGRDPLEFTIGGGRVIAGFEKAALGMAAGESKTVTIPAEEAYGPHVEEMVREVERSAIPADIPLEEGLQLQATGPNSQPLVLTVVAVGEETVTLDANHPLAGEDLTFEISLVEIV